MLNGFSITPEARESAFRDQFTPSLNPSVMLCGVDYIRAQFGESGREKGLLTI
jgi:hypothetical protein